MGSVASSQNEDVTWSEEWNGFTKDGDSSWMGRLKTECASSSVVEWACEDEERRRLVPEKRRLRTAGWFVWPEVDCVLPRRCSFVSGGSSRAELPCGRKELTCRKGAGSGGMGIREVWKDLCFFNAFPSSVAMLEVEAAPMPGKCFDRVCCEAAFLTVRGELGSL